MDGALHLLVNRKSDYDDMMLGCLLGQPELSLSMRIKCLAQRWDLNPQLLVLKNSK